MRNRIRALCSSSVGSLTPTASCSIQLDPRPFDPKLGDQAVKLLDKVWRHEMSRRNLDLTQRSIRLLKHSVIVVPW